MLSYDICKKLKEIGFPQELKIPTLSELIEACGDDFDSLERVEFMDLETKEKHNEWFVKPVEVLRDKFPGAIKYMIGQTPEEAVANLWIKLHEHK